MSCCATQAAASVGVGAAGRPRAPSAPSAAASASALKPRAAGRPLLATRQPGLPKQARVAARRTFAAAAAAEEASSASGEAARPAFSALVASADFFFNDVQNEAFAEQLRERVRFFGEQDRPIDFFFVPEPAWLEAKVEKAQLIKRPAVALVSSDAVWMAFMKLRLDRVLKADLKGMSDDEIFASASNYELPPFEKPLGSENWTAPYTPYEQGWWEAFYKK